MYSPAFGIGYSLWLRLRWVIIGIVIATLVLALLVQLRPDAAPYLGGASIVIVFMSMAFLLNAFSFGPADLGVKSSGFPTHMRVLPVSTRALAGWPMLFAAATVAVIWALPACLIFIPAGFPLPILWPATMLVALSVWVQAIGWSPMPSPFARVPLLIVAFTPLILPLTLGLTFFTGANLTAVVSVSCLSWSFAAYAFGVQGLSRARRGSEADWFRPITERWTARARRQYSLGSRRRPFRSPFAAQLWHECRRNAIVLPILLGFVGLPMLVALCLPVLDPHATPDGFLFGSTVLPPHLMLLTIWVALPFFFALSQGGGMAKFDVWGKIPMPAFFATRPVATSQFVLIKLCSTAISVAAAWAITFGLFAVWAALEASPLNSHASIIRATLAEATPRTIAIFFSAFLGLIAMTWRNLVSGMWPTLTGRKRLSVAIGFAFLAPYALAGGAGWWIYQHQEYHALFRAVLPWIVGALVALKFAVAVWLSLNLQQRGLIAPKMMRLLAVGWLALAGCLFCGLSFVTTPTWMLAAIVVMTLPFPSFAAAPLALDWNRHR